ncbi:nicotinate-nucleotide adenylyltransferase [Natranaerobius trueperi]|uniref:Probable nicotinate-nucleotide adenylyltransferase n=1 Tax=Natranaerobius trueperi TaxID=759412 RepID=A0A226BY39_9FIRM|nr:nicotinate-nucleotide adenylyltransferase [Natranaerobius trueperi]OWZ83933.1 nicotinic acid mononucleotide adenylyltransferase [Natranaerobius trueperi]
MGTRRRENNRVGLIGGTFDPIHTGHLIIAEEALNKFSLDEIIFIPAGIPPHKTSENITSSFHRYMLTNLATSKHPKFYVSSFEVDRDTPSYTIETLRYFRDLYSDKTDLFFITGIDTLLDILTWKDYRLLPDLCQFICATRPNFSFEKLEKEVFGTLPKLKNKIHYMDVPLIEISSTDIRKRCKNNESIKFMVPESVEAYILKEGLF